MPFANSCFISYRHSDLEQTRKIISQTVEALKAELEFLVPLPVFRDVERLQVGSFYNEALATALCKSVCMVMLYWPMYFSLEHTFCSREYHAMLRWEAERLSRLSNPVDRQNGLIVVIAFRDFKKIPAEISGNRLVCDFEAHSMRHNMTQKTEFKRDIREIGSYISERCRAFDAVPPPDPCVSCPECKFPGDQEILPWLQHVLHPGVPYPTREGDR
jgi:hypothetical protein